MKKRILSFLLAAALAASCRPMSAFAEEPAGPSGPASVGSIGSADGPTAILISETPETDGPAAPAAPEAPAPAAEAPAPETPAAPPAPDAAAEDSAQPAAPEAPDAPVLVPETPAEDAAEGPEEDHSLTYIAFGDSIAAGVGLTGFMYDDSNVFYDIRPNFKGYSNECYVSYVAEALGLDRDHAINLGLPALMTKDLLEMVRDGQMSEFNQPAGTYYSYPEFQDYIRKADVISIEIGMNDAMVPFIVSIGEATNWKSEQLANTIVSGGYRDMSFSSFVQMVQQLFSIRLTFKETSDLFYALTTGASNVCRDAYTSVETYLPQIIEAIRAQNPDAQILLLGCYNPVPLMWTWSSFFNKYNRFVRDLAEDTGCTYVPIPRTKVANDGHPTIAGHKYIARQIVDAIEQ